MVVAAGKPELRPSTSPGNMTTKIDNRATKSPTKPTKQKRKQMSDSHMSHTLAPSKEVPMKKIYKPIAEETFACLSNPMYECRTVNSTVEVADAAASTEGNHGVPKKRLSRHKPELIDSEVDLGKTKVRTHLDLSKLLPLSKLPPIEEDMTEGKQLDKAGKKRKGNKKALSQSPVRAKKAKKTPKPEEVHEKYPVLNNQELIQRFLKIPMTNNQKGRIRQVIKEILRGTSSTLLPDVLNNKINAILNSSGDLTDTDLRKIRILYNMLKKATEFTKIAIAEEATESLVKKEEPVVKPLNLDKKVKKSNEKDGKEEKKSKKIQRYVVFVGNLPLDVTRKQISDHFSEISEYIKDIRIPQIAKDKKSSIAYVEMSTGTSYEMALSKHHSMMGSKRINVQYTAHQNSKLTKPEVKAKSAKLRALLQKGQLAGSIAVQKKRSQRRAKQRAAQKAAENQ